MNKRTAAMIVNDTVEVAICQYQKSYGGEYKFLYDRTYLYGLVEGMHLIAQGVDSGHYSIIRFLRHGKLTDIDLDDEEIKYRWILGMVPEEVFFWEGDREDETRRILEEAQNNSIRNVRQQAKLLLTMEEEEEEREAPWKWRSQPKS